MNAPGRIEVPFSEAGQLCFDRMRQIVLIQLHRARGAVKSFVDASMPNAKFIDETAMHGSKYSALFALPSGRQWRVTYDYRTLEVDILKERNYEQSYN